MLDIYKEKWYNRYYHYIIHPLSKLRVSPNQWTVLGLIFGFTAAYYIYKRNLLISVFFILLVWFCDMCDGEIARKKKLETPFGSLFDTTVDKYVEGVIALAIGLIIPSLILPGIIWAFLSMHGSILVSLVSNIGRNLTTAKIFKIVARVDRGIILIIGLILGHYFGLTSLTYVVVFLTILSHLTVLFLLLQYYKILK